METIIAVLAFLMSFGAIAAVTAVSKKIDSNNELFVKAHVTQLRTKVIEIAKAMVTANATIEELTMKIEVLEAAAADSKAKTIESLRTLDALKKRAQAEEENGQGKRKPAPPRRNSA
jgi:hypothetical protein